MSQAELAAAAGVPLITYAGLESLRDRPWTTEARRPSSCVAPDCGHAPRFGAWVCANHRADEETRRRWLDAWRSSAPRRWREAALLVASFFDVTPEDLWPEEILRIAKPVAHRKMDVREAAALAGTAADPLALCEAKERVALLADGLQSLSAREQDILRRHFWHDETFEGIGADYKISRSGVSQLVLRAIGKLQRMPRIAEARNGMVDDDRILAAIAKESA